MHLTVNPLTPELNPPPGHFSGRHCLTYIYIYMCVCVCVCVCVVRRLKYNGHDSFMDVTENVSKLENAYLV